LVIRVRPAREPEPEPVRAARAAGRGRLRLLHRVYCWIDRLLFRRGSDALDAVDISDLIEHRPSVEVKLAAGEESFGEAELDRIRAYALDVVVCLGPEPNGNRVPRLARYGAWAYCFDDAGTPGGEPTGVRTVLGGCPATVASLNVLAAKPGGAERAIYRATLKAHRLSARRHADHVGRVSSTFVSRALRRLGQEGAPAAGAGLAGNRPGARANGIPGDGEMARLIARFGVRLAAEGLRRTLHRDQWILAYSTRDAWDGPRPNLSALRLLVPPSDRFWADPFPVIWGGKRYLFFEEYLYATGKGRIAAIEIDAFDRPGEPLTVLESDDHLAYPFVFRHDDELFMIPHAPTRGAVKLYRCVEFPGRWEFDRTLIAGVSAADATLAEHDGLWWLFACVAVEGTGIDTEELHLFHAESPLGPWRPHRHNPVKSDVGSARPAGRLYRSGEAWYRPAQDCTLGYGHSIVLNRVTRWDLDGYEEEPAGRIGPDWAPGVDRTHTFNLFGALFALDARVARPRFFPDRRRLGGKR
jgi:hypothetical protein